MNIVCLFLSFNGIGNDRGMYGDLVCEIANRGHKVYVIAASKNNRSGIERLGNISICWVNSIKLLNVGFITKAVANLLLPFLFLRASKSFLPEKIDLVVSPTPPITLTNIIGKIKKKRGASFFLILRDIFPQNAVDLKLMSSNSFIFKYFRKQEKKLYNLADTIGCMSPGNVNYLLKHNPEINPEKTTILPNWVDTKKKNVQGLSTFMEENNLEGKFIAVFGGNLGIAQNPQNVVDLAEVHKEKKDLIFLIIGKGTYKKRIEESIKQKKLDNIILADHLPRDEFEALASKCNVGIVSLNGSFTIPNIPSRTLGYWQASLPVFAIVDKHTDLGVNVIDRFKGGLWCIEGDKEKYKELFEMLYNNKELAEEMGRNGYKALREEFNASKAVDILFNKNL